jgi:predicted glycosyltransferase
MLREAGYLGVPAYSIFRSRIGAVDRHLASIGRLEMLSSPQDFARIELTPRREIEPLRTDSAAVEYLERRITERVQGRTPGS